MEEKKFPDNSLPQYQREKSVPLESASGEDSRPARKKRPSLAQQIRKRFSESNVLPLLPPRIVHGNAPEKNPFPDNRIVNTKYNLLSFLPKNLLEQFSLHINRYFLLIAVLQLFPVLTPVNPITTWGPLLVIFLISATKEAIDDLGRYREDTKANQRTYKVCRNGLKQNVESQNIHVGDIIYLTEGEEIPCDVLLLTSSNKSGLVYIQTANLDGETMLKERFALNQTQNLPPEILENFNGVCQCAAPNKEVYKFDARLWLDPSPDMNVPTSMPLSISSDQLVQQTCSLANTEYFYGMAVYTGNETKFGKNKGAAPTKITKVDNLINTIAIYLFLFQLSLVVIFGLVGNVYHYDRADSHWYLRNKREGWYDFLIIPLRFLLLNSTMIPISLKVTMDLCKLLYARFINFDMKIINEETGEVDHIHARNTSISEDLGQIEFILTDKTGTLTQNSMVFKQCSIDSQLYDESECEIGGRLTDAVKARRPAELEFLRHFALNNSVIPVNKDGTITYKGSSPDETALVSAAANLGVRLVHREGKNVHITVNGEIERYVLLEELKFTSDRKRMSSVLMDASTKQLKLYCKGADDVIAKRLRNDEAQQRALKSTMVQLEIFASQGLRTLFLSSRNMTQDEFNSWKVLFQQANTQIEDREQALSNVYDLLEKDLRIQGCSAIEDKLQNNVPETISTLRAAGIKFWMLTGDKFSTALQIATSCNLKSADERTQLCEVEGADRDSIRENVLFLLETVKATNKEIVVVVRGSTLGYALSYAKLPFMQLCLSAHTVICCRVSPAQKADLVQLVREAKGMTLAIGDGGNDVPMIQQAHVGVGIRGKEGLQASRAADYSVSHFSALTRLILIHGRYSYLRTSLVAQYSYYKSFFFCCIQIFYGFVSFFSGSTLFNSLCITMYNAVLFVPIVSFVLDKDVSFDTVLQIFSASKLPKNPSLYRDCVQSKPFNYKTMAWWNVRGFYQALVIFFFTIYIRSASTSVPSSGFAADYETMGIFAFCAYLWVQALTMTMELQNLTWISLLAIWGMHGLTFLILALTNAVISFDSINGYGIAFQSFGDGQFWLSNLVMTVGCMAPVLFSKASHENFYPTLAQRLRFVEREAKIQNVSSSPP